MKKGQIIGIILGVCVLGIILHLGQPKISCQVDDNRFFVEFSLLNRELTESFLLREGDVIGVNIVRNKGRLQIVIGQQGQEPIYEGNDFPGSFQVNVPEDGNYTITVSGKRAEGIAEFQILSPASMTSDMDRVPAFMEAPTVEEAYAVVIGEYYTAIEQQWDSAALMDKNFCYLIDGCYGNDPLGSIGYRIGDIDGDGTEELLIGALAGDSFYGKMIFALYTLDDKGVHQLVFDSSERNRYYYAGENRLANVGAGTFGESFETTLKFEDRELIDMTCTTDPSDYVQAELTAFSEWIK